MKDHELRELVNALTETAREFAHTDQLRERIAGIVRPAVSRMREQIEALEKIASVSKEILPTLCAMQAEIDSLMIEFCPDEMSPRQLAEWAARQRPSQ